MGVRSGVHRPQLTSYSGLTPAIQLHVFLGSVTTSSRAKPKKLTLPFGILKKKELAIDFLSL